jgi:Bacteriophage baseplate protein W
VALVQKQLIGKGIGFPVRIGAHGGFAMVSETDEIDEAVTLIIGTSPGERRMRPQFGCRIQELVFAPLNSETVGSAIRYVEEALGLWEPRIDVDSVEVDVDQESQDAAQLLITINYTVKRTKDERTLVYPFYVIEQHSQ